ncbi:hypothetical protein EYF80_014743 [Liparis tanakae]|uniref:Uncharacterized protein n=1 Tax=Liparis tanakae TaxID=230148 RepID=A0A4Z2IAL0_9TELE|nr:hypothetical protein EYF80_014743 [Liparis tanakae]
MLLEAYRGTLPLFRTSRTVVHEDMSYVSGLDGNAQETSSLYPSVWTSISPEDTEVDAGEPDSYRYLLEVTVNTQELMDGTKRTEALALFIKTRQPSSGLVAQAAQ